MTLRAENLSFAIGKKRLLSDIDFELADPSITLILGPNGAGKTLLLRCLAGLLNPFRGRVTMPGIDNLYSCPRQVLAKRLGWFPFANPLPFEFTAIDIILMGRYPIHQGYPTQRDQLAAEQALERMHISDLKARVYNSLSRGEQTKVDLARALASEISLLLFDEPFANLDIDTSLYVRRLFQELVKEGRSILLSHHDLHSVHNFASHVAFVKEGRLLGAGPVEQFFTESFINEAYGVHAKILSVGPERFISFMT